jgi:hypothetical protein
MIKRNCEFSVWRFGGTLLTLTSFLFFGCSTNAAEIDGVKDGAIIAWQWPLDSPIPCVALTTGDSESRLVEMSRTKFGCLGTRGLVTVRTSPATLKAIFSSITESRQSDVDARPWLAVMFINGKRTETTLDIPVALNAFRVITEQVPESREEIDQGLVFRFQRDVDRAEGDGVRAACAYVREGMKLANRCRMLKR